MARCCRRTPKSRTRWRSISGCSAARATARRSPRSVSAALSAMQMLADFEPRLVGSVLTGTATEHNDIQLHLFAERAESITSG